MLKKSPLRNKHQPILLVLIAGGLAVLISACQALSATPVYTQAAEFVPPTADPGQIPPTQPAPPPQPTRQTGCQNQLKFLDDLTVPDGSEFIPGERITKRWLIKNDGTCNWDQYYTIQLISGLALGADKVQSLYPARQSTEAVIEILFHAPDNPGRYNSWWQAYDPDGGRFGDPVYMEISVMEEIIETEVIDPEPALEGTPSG